jgi:transposase
MTSKLADKEEQDFFINTFYYMTKAIKSIANEKCRKLKYLCVDEATFCRDGTIHNGLYLKGLTPEIYESNGRFQKIKLFGAVDPIEGDITLKKIKGKMTLETHAKLLKYLSNKYSDYELVIVEDNAPWHKRNKILKLLDNYGISNVNIINIPKYSPTMNPCEKLWNWMRETVSHCRYYPNLKSLSDSIWRCYRRIYNKVELAKIRLKTEIPIFSHVA